MPWHIVLMANAYSLQPDELDLSRNTKLAELRLTLQTPPVRQHGTNASISPSPCTWLYALLSTIASKELAYFTLEFDVRDLDPGSDAFAALDMVSMLLDPALSSAIDTLLTGSQFKRLESVYLGMFCARPSAHRRLSRRGGAEIHLREMRCRRARDRAGPT